jgi:transposase
LKRRWAIILLHKMRRDDAAIAKEVDCDARSVRHWIEHYQQHGSVDDLPRSGRKRKTTAEQDEAMVAEAKETKFTTPRRIKRKLHSDVSSRTINRRLQEHGLFGRVAQHKKKFSEEEKRKRQDNAPQHKSVLVRTWLFNHGIQCLDFPPYSPDLNPIENLWADLARRVEKFQCSTMETLQDIVAQEWAKTPKEYLRKLARSMPERCQAVIKAHGDHTKF